MDWYPFKIKKKNKESREINVGGIEKNSQWSNNSIRECCGPTVKAITGEMSTAFQNGLSSKAEVKEGVMAPKWS